MTDGLRKHPVFGLLGKSISGISTSSDSDGDIGNIVIKFVDGTALSISERYMDCGGWASFDVEVREGERD